jgi:hypothetical protein
MVVSVVGATLVQVPNRLAGHSREQVRQLVEKCFAHCRAFLDRPLKSSTIDRSEFLRLLFLGIADRARRHTHLVSQSLIHEGLEADVKQ